MSGTSMGGTMSPLILAAELPGRPVVAIDCGDDVAEIKDVVFDPLSHELVGFTLNKRGWFRGSLKADLPASEIHGIGPVAVMVATSDSLVSLDDASPELDTSSDAVTVIGTRVLSSTGEALGKIVDVVLETSATPTATGYKVEADDGAEVFIPISAQLALSGDNLVLPANATAFVRNDLAGFGAAVIDYRNSLETSS